MNTIQYLGEQSENINSLIQRCIAHKKLYLNYDPELSYYLITFVCNYTNDTEKSYNTLLQCAQNIYDDKNSSQLAIGWEVNTRGYMHIHSVVSFKTIPLFTKYRYTGTQLNFKPLQTEQDLKRANDYIYKQFDEYGFSKSALCLEHLLHHHSL